MLLGLLTLVCILIIASRRQKEPSYSGHMLSYWLGLRQAAAKATRPHAADAEESEKAILAIGTNAIPWLLEWIQYEPNSVPKPVLNRVQWSFWSTRIGGFLMFGAGHRNSRAEAVVRAFGILGTNAASATSDLVLLMQDNSRPMTSARATMALGGLGEAAFPALAQALFSPKQRERQLVALELFEMSHGPSVGTNKVLPLVIRAMNDPDPSVSRYAAEFFAKIAPDAQQIIPSE